MAMGNLDFIAEQLIKNGMEEETPSVVITNVSLPSQRTVSGSLRQLDEKCKQQTVGPPSIVIIGAAAGSDRCLNWFMKKPLFGRNIVVTRDEKGNADFADKIISQGANPLEFPTIKIKPLTHTNKFLRTLAEIAEFDWVIFTSPNGVTVFFECLRSLARDGRIFGSAKIAAIGSETAAKLGEFGIRADFVSGVFSGKELGKQLTSHANLQDKKILLLRSELASNELTEVLIKAKAEVKEAPVYTVTPEKSDCTWLKEAIAERTINWLTFASPSSANVFFEQIEGDLVNSSGVKVASIGPVTSEQLKNLGVKVDAEAAVHTIDGLLAAIEEKDSV
jgi:uroporphyrinogen III methyltransferase/synthase